MHFLAIFLLWTLLSLQGSDLTRKQEPYRWTSLGTIDFNVLSVQSTLDVMVPWLRHYNP